jgi:hypothetical protein
MEARPAQHLDRPTLEALSECARAVPVPAANAAATPVHTVALGPSASLDGALDRMAALQVRLAAQERTLAARRLLRRLRGRGLTLSVADGKLMIGPARLATSLNGDRDTISEYREELVRILTR